MSVPPPRMGPSSPTAKSERSASSGSTRSSTSSSASQRPYGAAGAANALEDAAVSDRVWARAIHAVTEQKLGLRSVARLYGLHHLALHRRVRARQSAQQTQHRLNDDAEAASAASGCRYGRMAAATERFEPPAWLPERVSDLDSVRLSAEQNDEAMALLYEEYGPSIVRLRRGDGSTGEEYCFDDGDICEVVRFVLGRDAHRELPAPFPTPRWLAAFKRENGLAAGVSPFQEDSFHQRFQYAATLHSHEQPSPQQAQLQQQQQQQQQEAPSAAAWGLADRSAMRPQQSMDRDQYYSTSEDESIHSSPRQRSPRTVADQRRRHHQQQQTQEPAVPPSETKAGSDGKLYRQSNTVPAEVWDRAMEDVLIHGMSLRSAAKTHGVHFAALHRRLKKRSLQKESLPFDPRYIPFEDEAGLIRVINARADLGVLMSYHEVVDLLRRATLNHRSELADDDAAELIRKFRSRVEASIRHLVKDWPLPSVDALYQQLGPVPTSNGAASASSSSLASTSSAATSTSSTCSSVSPRPMLPPASTLRSPNSGAGFSTLLSPHKWNSSGDANGLGRPRPSSDAPSPRPLPSTILRL